MSRLIMLFGMSMLCFLGNAQNNLILTGKITDEKGRPLTGASVILFPGNTGMLTDEKGTYSFASLVHGKYQITASFLGYQTITDSLWLNAYHVHDIQLEYVPINLDEVVVRDNYAESRKKSELLSVEVVNDEYLKQNLGGSLMQSLERLPGVSTIEIGSGQSKPVIRGLGFNRVVVVENGIKHEGQQWGADHGLEIDQYAADRMEVVKGPTSLVYGSDAIGGVIDIKQNHVPDKNSLVGEIDLTGKSNNQLLGSSVMVAGRKEWFYAKLQATVIDYGDYKVPADSVDIYSYKVLLYNHHLRNTAGQEQDLHLGFGILLPQFQSRFYLSSVNSKSGFFANAHGVEPRNVDTEAHDKSGRDILHPYQKVNHFKAINKISWQLGKAALSSDLGFQHNFRQERSEYVSHGYMPPELPESLGMNSDLEREFDKYVYSGALKMNYRHNETTVFDAGISSEIQDNNIGGYGFIIPAFKQFTAGAFLIAKYSFSERSRIQVGVRYDYGRINTRAYYDWFSSPVDDDANETEYLQRGEDLIRRFSNFSWSVGYNYTPNEWMLKVNLGKSFRMPIAKELASNGVNYHHFSYEAGNPDLSAEVSYQLDAGAEFHTKKMAIGATPFLNYFPNYIYLNPTSEHDRLYGNGNQVYYYLQSRVFRYGGEIHAHYQLLKSLQVGVMGEYIYSEQLSGAKKGFTLPFSPPASAIINLKYLQDKLGFVSNFYLSLDYRLTAAQNRIVPPEEITDGYQIVNLGSGGGVEVGKQKLEVSVQVQNLLNTKYFNHTSYYRLINLPEAGRNIILNVSVPFTGKL